MYRDNVWLMMCWAGLRCAQRVVSVLSANNDPSQNQDLLAVSKVAEMISSVFGAGSREASLRQAQYQSTLTWITACLDCV